MRRFSKLVAILLVVVSMALMITSAPVVSAATPVLKVGMEGDDVLDLQQKLKALGYFDTECTGYFGAVTEAAVMAFQAEYNLSADGVVGNDTYRLLASLTADSFIETLEIVQGIYTRAEILEIQQLLYDLGFLSVEPTGYYGEITIDAARRYQKKYNLTVDGIVGRNTLSSMRKIVASRNDPTGSMYIYDWWSEAQYIFGIGDRAVVTDVATGIKFTVMRTYGSNHADVETVSASDTAKFRSCYGGRDSWERRAIVVVVNGTTMAASMNGYAHAGSDSAKDGAWVSWRSGDYGAGINLDRIKGNNLNGVFCIHFKNSTTHGTGLVCKLHQACIKQAASYIAAQDW